MRHRTAMKIMKNPKLALKPLVARPIVMSVGSGE